MPRKKKNASPAQASLPGAASATKKTRIPLPHVLDADLIQAKGVEVSRMDLQINEKRREKLHKAKEFTDEIKEIEARRNELAAVVSAAAEERETDCEVTKNFNDNTITITREDDPENWPPEWRKVNGTMTRDMTEKELTEPLPDRPSDEEEGGGGGDDGDMGPAPGAAAGQGNQSAASP